MSKPIEGKPAFPTHPLEHDRYWHEGETGLSERRYYIGQALAGFCANPEMTHHDHESMAKLAIQQADALMKFLYPQTQGENNEEQI